MVVRHTQVVAARPLKMLMTREALKPLRTATAVPNRANWWHPVLLSEFRPTFPNGQQRSVNHKVQGSNPCPEPNLISNRAF